MGLDTVDLAEKLTRDVGKTIGDALLNFGSAVRADERAKHSAKVSLLQTIAANVDNDKLSDADFRVFVRNSLA